MTVRQQRLTQQERRIFERLNVTSQVEISFRGTIQKVRCKY